MKKIFKKIYSFFIWVPLLLFSLAAYSVDDEPENIRKKFIFATLAHEVSDPDSYTLVCLDSNLIPESEKADQLKKRKEFNPIRNWLRKELLERAEENDTLEKLYVAKRERTGTSYYLVTLYQKPSISASEHLTTRLWGTSVRQLEDDQYSATMLIFPQSSSPHALAYLFGGWRQLCNPYAIIHDWGLRLAATQEIFSDKNIKALLGKNNFDPNPTSRTVKKKKLAPIETFVLEVGTEGLQTLTILPKYALNADFKRLVVGSDTYKFFLPEAKEGKRGDTIGSLVAMANYLYSIYSSKRFIHPKLRHYLDDEVTNPDTIDVLNELLLEILKAEDAHLKVFPSDDIWKGYRGSPKFSYGKNKEKPYLLEALKGQKFTLDSVVSIKKAKSNQEGIIGRIVYSLPIEDEDNKQWYRFDRGRWFNIAPSRFMAIIQIMRDPEIKVDIPALLSYTTEDAMGAGRKIGGLYQEDRYNRRIVAALKGKKQKAVLLDRLNIYFSGKGNKFEFGDIFLYGDKGQNYIVHVKRKEAGDIDHHRTQVERCAEYLATELNKQNAKNILLLGCVNGLYIEYGVPITGKKAKHLTRGTFFKNLFAKNKQNKLKWDNYLKNIIFSNTKNQASTTTGKLKVSLSKIDLSFFEDHKDELVVALNALHDCCDKTKTLSEKTIQDFIESIRQLIEIREVLFSKGTLSAAVRKKTTIVMAVVDDRQIEPIRKAEKALKKSKSKAEQTRLRKEITALKAKDRSKESELFHDQQLWGLDRTRQLVQKHGFKFNLAVINENDHYTNWDAFGYIKEDNISEDSSENSDEEDIKSKKPSSKKKITKAKKSKKVDETSSSENGSTNDTEEQSEDSKNATKHKSKGKSKSSNRTSKNSGKNNDSEEDIGDYQYTSTDINRLLHIPLSEELPEDAEYTKFSLSDANIDDDADTNDIVHCLNNRRYVLPPVVSHAVGHEEKSPSETLIDLLSYSFYTHETIIEYPPEEMIIPFNPGGHWVTLQILIPELESEEITFNYIDSLVGISKVGISKSEARLFLAFLKGKYLGRTIKFVPLLSRIQPDNKSCGAVTVENTKDLFREKPLPNMQISLSNILKLKKEHKDYLISIGVDKGFDFD